MADAQVNGYLTEMAEIQQQVLAELSDMPRDEFLYQTDHWRWNTVRRVLLRFGDHVREHTTQLVEAREATGADQTMTQRILAQAMQAYGYWLGAMVGLEDEHLDETYEGEWSPRQVLEHMIVSQRAYLDMIRRAREAKTPVDKD